MNKATFVTQVEEFYRMDGEEVWDEELLRKLAEKAGYRSKRWLKAIIRWLASYLDLEYIYKEGP